MDTTKSLAAKADSREQAAPSAISATAPMSTETDGRGSRPEGSSDARMSAPVLRAFPVPTESQEPRPRGLLPLAIIACANLMAVLDTTVIFIALPSIQHGLHMSVTDRQWVVTAYTLALASFLLLGGRLADRFGARRTLLVGVIGFAVASAVGGASTDGATLTTVRAVQGAFGAVLMSSTRSLLISKIAGQEAWVWVFWCSPPRTLIHISDLRLSVCRIRLLRKSTGHRRVSSSFSRTRTLWA
jgi:hypothetical protein